MIDEADSRYQSCKALLNAGDLEAARSGLALGLAAWPAHAGLHRLWGYLALREGRGTEALAAFIKAIDLGSADAWRDFDGAFVTLSSYVPTLALIEKIIAAILRDDVDGGGVLRAAGDILRSQFRTLEKIGAPLSWTALVKLERKTGLQGVSRLLLVFLEHGRTLTPALERILIALRRDVLGMAANAPAAQPEDVPLDLPAALGIHCFNNEYVFAESDDEARMVEKLSQALSASASPFAAAVLSCYRPLGEEAPAVADLQSENRLFRRLLEAQIFEPRRERTLADCIPSVTAVTDDVSVSVRQQYEENPYPRWQRLKLPPAAASAVPPERLLVAGCGTGYHALLFALLYPTAKVSAIDLSRRSLAYGQRKAEEYGARNVTFLQGDILELPRLALTFDRIACGGVIHHMRSPETGLRALHACTVPRGILTLDVYTESGRQPVVAGIALREAHGLKPTPQGIRRFREIVFSLPATHPAAALAASEDFYSMSECRDQSFHVQEHRFSLPVLAAMAGRTGFKVAHIHAKSDGLAKFRDIFPDRDAGIDVEAWGQIESANPGIFGSMYRVDFTRD